MMIKLSAVILSAALSSMFSAAPLANSEVSDYNRPTLSVEVKGMTVGDSITFASGPGYRTELSRMLDVAQVEHEIVDVSVPGESCVYWSQHLEAKIIEHDPDFILLNCGTNDNLSTNAATIQFEIAYKTILNIAASYNVKIVASWIQYSDPRVMAANLAYLPQNENNANNAIYRVIFGTPYPNVPIADFQQLPSNYEFLADGIHPTLRGYRYMGRIFYDALATIMNWSSSTALGQTPLCGKSGIWKDYPPMQPSVHYIECNAHVD